jgi:hypothetical protein
MSGVTLREKIISKVQQILEAIASPVNLSSKVERNLKVAIGRSEAPLVSVEPIVDDPNNESIQRVTWTLKIRISLIVRGLIPDQVADPIIESIHEAIMADITLGGLAMGIEPGPVNFEFMDSDSGGGIFPIDYAISYQTKRESMATI